MAVVSRRPDTAKSDTHRDSGSIRCSHAIDAAPRTGVHSIFMRTAVLAHLLDSAPPKMTAWTL